MIVATPERRHKHKREDINVIVKILASDGLQNISASQ